MKRQHKGGNIKITRSGLGGRRRRDFFHNYEAVHLQTESLFRLVLVFKQ